MRPGVDEVVGGVPVAVAADAGCGGVDGGEDAAVGKGPQRGSRGGSADVEQGGGVGGALEGVGDQQRRQRPCCAVGAQPAQPVLPGVDDLACSVSELIGDCCGMLRDAGSCLQADAARLGTRSARRAESGAFPNRSVSVRVS